MTDRQNKMKEGQHATSCIKHLAVSWLSSVSARIKSGCNLIGNHFEMQNGSYAQPLIYSSKTKTTKAPKYEHEFTNMDESGG